MRLICFVLALIFVANLTNAGAWPREKGALFIAAGGNFLLSDGARLPVHYDPTLYAEYGLTPRITIGLNFYTADAGEVVSGLTFVRVPIGPLNGVNKHAVSLAFGSQRHPKIGQEMIMQAGYSWGRSLENGWFSMDSYATVGTSDGNFRAKTDLTWGRRWSEDWSTMFQLQTGQGLRGDFYAKVSPAVIYDFNEGIKVHLAAVRAFTGDQGSALKLEMWFEF